MQGSDKEVTGTGQDKEAGKYEGIIVCFVKQFSATEIFKGLGLTTAISGLEFLRFLLCF